MEKILDNSVLIDALGDDVETIKEIVDSYIEDLPGHAEKLAASIQAGDLDEARKRAHSIKGGAANLGGKRLHALAGEMEDAAEKGNTDFCRQNIDCLKEELGLLIDALKKETWQPN